MHALATMIALLSGCEKPAVEGASDATGDLTLTVSENVVTYFTADWTSDALGRTRVEIDDGEVPVLVTDWQEGPSGTGVPILGVWPSHTFTARLVDEEGTVLDSTSFTTESGPTELSQMTSVGTATWTGYAIVELASIELQTVAILAPNGQPVWYWQRGAQFLSRAALRKDGRGIWLVGMPSEDTILDSWLGSVDWDGNLLVDLEPFGNNGEGMTHDVLELDDGRLLFLGPETRIVQEVPYVGDTLFALETDGTETRLWSFWDTFTPDGEIAAPPSWSHANALQWNEERSTVWVGARALSTLVELDPATWKPVSQIGGPKPTFIPVLEAKLPYAQHQFAFQGDRLAIHDNRDPDIGSRVVVYDLDFAAQTLTETWEYVPDPVRYDFVLGDVAWLREDALLITWSTAGLMEERSLDGNAPWSVVFDLGTFFGYTQHIDALPGSTPVQ